MLIGTACDERQTTLNLSCKCMSTTRGMRMKSRRGVKEIICEEAEARFCLLTYLEENATSICELDAQEK